MRGCSLPTLGVLLLSFAAQAWAGSGAALSEPTPSPAATGSSAPSAAPPAADSKASESSAEAPAEKKVPRTIVELQNAIKIFREETARSGARSGGRGSSSTRNAAQSLSYHGRIFEYIRNNAFDATPHEVRQRGGQRNILRRNQFGASISGPVVIPKLYDGRRNTFFTFSYEGTREKVGRSYLRTVPTGIERAGDFSDLVNKGGKPVTVYDPESTRLNPTYDPARQVSLNNLEYEREEFPNNQVPASRMDPVALAAGEQYPLPNTNVGPFLQNNFWSNPSERNEPNGIIARVDHNLFKRHKVTVNLAYSRGFQGQPRIYDTVATPSRPDRNFWDRRLEVEETYAISPNTVYSGSLGVNSTLAETVNDTAGRNLPEELGLHGVSGDIFPSLRFRTYYGMGASSGSHLRNAINSYSMSHSLTARRGAHSWAVSAVARRRRVNTLELDTPSGALSFNDSLTGLPGINNTGNSYASFLLGLPNLAETSDQPQPAYFRRSEVDLGIRDTIDVAENLTLTLGLDIDTVTPRVEKYDRQSTLDFDAVNPADGLAGALVFANRDGYGRGFSPTRTTFEPRVSLSWSPTKRRDTVVRMTLMQYQTPGSIDAGVFGTQGFYARRNPLSPNRQLAPALVLKDGFPASGRPLPDLAGDAANETAVDLIAQTRLLPRYRYFRLDLERRLPSGLTLRASGRVYRGKNTLATGQAIGFNRVPLEALDYRDQLNDESFRRTLRPFPHYQRVMTHGGYPDGRYLYNVGDFSLEKRTGQGLSFELAYQVRKRWDDYPTTGSQNPFDRSQEWARTRGTRPHRISLSYAYDLPFGQGKAMLNRAGVFSKVLGNWSLSGFTSWLSGDPIQLEPEFNNTGGIVPYLRVNSVPGVALRPDDPGPELWFDPDAFAHPDDFSIGNVSRSHPTLRNPNWQNHDIAVTKRVPLSTETSLELLFQGFNFLNHANWNEPDATIGTAAAPNDNAGKIIGSTGGRVLQFGMRYNF